MGCRQFLLLSVVQLKGKHCQKAHCCNGVADTFGDRLTKVFHNFSGDCWNLENIFRVYLQIVLEALYSPCVAKDPQVCSKCVICFPLKQYIHSTHKIHKICIVVFVCKHYLPINLSDFYFIDL